jgi:hypothetical protein
MRYALAVILLIFCLTSSAQKLTENQIDKFTKQKRLQTSEVLLKGKLTEGMYIRFRSVDSSLFATLIGYGVGVGVIGEKDQAIFLLDNDETVTIYSTGIQSYDVGQYGSSYRHQYSISLNDLKILSQHNVKSVRKYTSKGYGDIDVPEKNQGNVKKIALLILNNL